MLALQYWIIMWKANNFPLRAGVLCQCSPWNRLPKSHGKREGLVGRCLQDNRVLSWSLKDGDNACRLRSKLPFTVGMESVTRPVMQRSVCISILLVTLKATLWHLFRVLEKHFLFVCVSDGGICVTVQLTCEKCSVLSGRYVRSGADFFLVRV